MGSKNYTANGYVNLEAKVWNKETNAEVTDITLNNFVGYGTNTYTLKFTPEKSNYVIRFYYTSQIANVVHKYADGNVIEKITNQIIPDTFYKRTDIPLIDSSLNGVSKGKNIDSISVSIISGKTNPHEVVFVYGEPDIVFDPSGEQGTNKDIAIKYELGVVPSNRNNQLVESARVTDKHWVLDEDSFLKIRYIEENPAEDIYDNITYKTEITFPFDVYVNGTYIKANNAYTTSKKYTYQADETVTESPYMKIYEMEVKDIYVPIWAVGGVYNKNNDNRIKVKITQSYTKNVDGVETSDSNVKNGYGSVTVVGRVYDFSVINLEADEKWQSTLFSGKEGHLSDTLPLGQNNAYQPKQYTTGILKGAPIYFSLNTKGSDNERIIIKPSFYYAEKGASGTSVELVQPVTLKDSKGNALNTKGIVLSNNGILTYLTGKTELDNDRKAASEYGLSDNLTGNINLGNSSLLTLNKNVKLPYAGYVSEFNKTLPTGKETKNLLEEASQWYGCYTIPNDAVAYDANDKKLDNGFIIVYFEIITQRKNTSGQWVDYLAYSLPSPIRDTGDSEWKIEREGTIGEYIEKYVLPRKSKTQSDKKNVATWLIENAAATIIYDINASTKDNYTSVGTH